MRGIVSREYRVAESSNSIGTIESPKRRIAFPVSSSLGAFEPPLITSGEPELLKFYRSPGYPRGYKSRVFIPVDRGGRQGGREGRLGAG